MSISPLPFSNYQKNRVKDTCYVIMPLSGTSKNHDKKYWEFFYKYVLRTVIEINYHQEDKIHYVSKKPEEGRENIMKDVINNLDTADLVIGILTDKNANVWYELGVRHTLKKPTIMIMKEEEEIPFDIHQYGIVTYNEKMITKSRLLSLIHYLTAPIRKLRGIHNFNPNENVELMNKSFSILFDHHNSGYIRYEGRREKISIDEYAKFKERLQFFLYDKRTVVDNPVMEFMDIPLIQLIARTDKIEIGKTLEIRAELSKRDCNPISKASGYFAIHNPEIAKLEQEDNQKTDEYGVIYGEVKGLKKGETYVMVMIESSKEVIYASMKITIIENYSNT